MLGAGRALRHIPPISRMIETIASYCEQKAIAFFVPQSLIIISSVKDCWPPRTPNDISHNLTSPAPLSSTLFIVDKLTGFN